MWLVFAKNVPEYSALGRSYPLCRFSLSSLDKPESFLQMNYPKMFFRDATK